jgi:hypothetical protein
MNATARKAKAVERVEVPAIETIRTMARWKADEADRCLDRAISFFTKAEEAARRDKADLEARIKNGIGGRICALTNWTKHYGEEADKAITEHDQLRTVARALEEVSCDLCWEDAEKAEWGAR